MNSSFNNYAQRREGPARPVIGISARTVPVTVQGLRTTVSLALQSHVDMLASADGIPLLVPLVPGAEHTVPQLDGLLVPGGPDVDPALYGQERHPRTRCGSPEADRVELALIEAALDAGLPVLAICRGMQLLNVLHGGTLHQHMPELVGHDGHSPETEAFTLGRTRLDLHAGSAIDGVLGNDVPEARCHHHQGIDRVGTGLTVTAEAPDGVAEVVEAAAHPFVLGVQWEAGQDDDERLHHALVGAARKGRSASSREREGRLPARASHP